MFVKGRDIPEGYRAMSQQDVTDNWSACTSAMGAWDIISLLDGKVDGAGYGNQFRGCLRGMALDVPYERFTV